MVAVFLLFLIPVGGGIPAGVLLARDKHLAWAATAALYGLSDLILAAAFEPVLKLLVALGRRVAILARLGAACATVMARSTAPFQKYGTGPLSLVMISFGVDPMTGRTAALAAGHGFIAGWAFAIAGDMLYYGVVAATTLGLNARLRNPDLTVLIILAAMMGLPWLVGIGRSLWERVRAAG